MRPFVFDMETGDPDDVLTLLWFLGHPQVDLRAVTVTPGTPYQVGVVRHVLGLMDTDIPVGAFNIQHGADRDLKCVSGWHYKVFGPIPPSTDARPGWQVLRDHLDDAELVTGAPNKNLGGLLRSVERPPKIRWTAQGGFAGEGVVPPEKQLPKFKGKRAVQTYNLNGDPSSVELALASDAFAWRRFVSKNVCHGVIYDITLHAQVASRLAELSAGPHRRSLELIHGAMDKYLRKRPAGKAFHDPLAACCALDPSIGTWAEVELSRTGGRWGSCLSDTPNATIIVDYDHERFVDVLLGR